MIGWFSTVVFLFVCRFQEFLLVSQVGFLIGKGEIKFTLPTKKLLLYLISSVIRSHKFKMVQVPIEAHKFMKSKILESLFV